MTLLESPTRTQLKMSLHMTKKAEWMLQVTPPEGDVIVHIHLMHLSMNCNATEKAKVIKIPVYCSNFCRTTESEASKTNKQVWMILASLHSQIPMWTAWNSLVTVDPLPIQTVCYLQNISLPPTSLNVVAETLRIAQRVASECGEKYATVTYDLAIAKPASQIQEAELPTFNTVFIMFGAFHIMMAYFSSIGYFLEGSGNDTIMLDMEVLVSGSLKGFLSGKHYNRCKRLHVLLATALRAIHFR